MYNKKIRLILYAVFFMSANVFSQKVIVKNDTSMNVKFVNTDRNLILPELKTPEHLCVEFRETWNHYLKNHKDVTKNFFFDTDSSNYYSSITLDILPNGMVSNIKDKKWYSKLDSICNKAFGTILRKSLWIASYKKDGQSRKYVNTTVQVYFTITKRGLERLNFVDLKTFQSFYKCF